MDVFENYVYFGTFAGIWIGTLGTQDATQVLCGSLKINRVNW